MWNGCAWSVKTVHNSNPFHATLARLISGRNSPDYSLGIQNPHANPQATGHAVLAIWNARVNEALNEFNDLRIVAMVRNMELRQFLLFEEEATRFTPADYRWEFNQRGNLEGFNRTGERRAFTWQPHGSQFTIHRQVPAAARKFSINRNVPMLTPDAILASVRFNPNWITIHGG